MKRVISASLIALLLIGIIGGSFFYFKKFKTISDRAINAIPPDASFFIDFYPDAGNLNKVLNSYFFADIKNESRWKKFERSLAVFDSITASNESFRNTIMGGHLVISAHVTKAADFDFLYLFSLPPGYSERDCETWVRAFAGEPHNEMQIRNYDGENIRDLPLGNHSSFTFTVTKGVFAGSSTSFLVEDAIRQQKLKKPFGGNRTILKIYEKESVHHEDKIYFNFKNLPKWFNLFTDGEKNVPFSLVDNFGGWSFLSIQPEKDHIRLSGFSTEGDSSRYINLFRNQLASPMKLPDVLPSRTAAFLFYGMSNNQSYFSALKKYLDVHENGAEKERYINTLDAAYKTSIRMKMQSWIGKEYAIVITEPAGSNYDNNVLAFFSAPDQNKALKNLRELGAIVSANQSSKITEEKYNGYTIGLINFKGVMQSLYGDVFKRLNKFFYTSVDGYVIISNQASSLRSYLDDYENKNFLFTDDEKNILKNQDRSCNFFLYSRIPACKYIFNSIGSKDAIEFLAQYKGLSQWNAFSYRIKKTALGFETSAYLQYAQKPATGVNQVWITDLDTTVEAGPFFAGTAIGQKQIIVQDASHTLYLIDNAGNIIWRKILNEKISGQIYTLDIYKNGQSQFFFNTTGYLQMVDLKGNDLNGFPIRLPAPSSNGAVVFDYEKNNDFRIYVACSNGIVYGFQVNGKPLPGWNFNSHTGWVADPLQYFHKNEQDYLVFNDTAGQVYIVGKTGESIIAVKQLLGKNSGSLFYLDEDLEGNYSFLTLDTSGSLCHVMPDGFIRVHPVLEDGKGYNMTIADMDHDGENDILFNNGRQILIYQKDSIRVFARIPGEQAVSDILKLDSGGGELNFGTWSPSLDKLYLFNADGTIYKGFPVKGSRKFSLDEMNNDGRRNILTSSGKSVLLYVLD